MVQPVVGPKFNPDSVIRFPGPEQFKYLTRTLIYILKPNSDYSVIPSY